MLDYINQFDFSVLYWIQENIRTVFLDGFAGILNSVFNAGIFWIVLGAVLIIFRKTRTAGFMVLAAMGLALIVGELSMKNIICRPRPCHIDTAIALAVKRPDSFSFPSGHTGSSFGAATALFMWNKKWGIPALAVAALVGLSRLYLFVHFPTDVLAGAVLGILCGVLTGILFRKFRVESRILKNGNK